MAKVHLGVQQMIEEGLQELEEQRQEDLLQLAAELQDMGVNSWTCCHCGEFLGRCYCLEEIDSDDHEEDDLLYWLCH